MAAGKNKVERYITFAIGDVGAVSRDLSGDLVPGTLAGAGGLVFDKAEMTGVSDALHNWLADHANSDISADFYLNDTASTGAHTVLKAINGLVRTIIIDFGAGVAPVTGDPEWTGAYLVIQAQQGMAGNKPVLKCKFAPGSSVAPLWQTKP